MDHARSITRLPAVWQPLRGILAVFLVCCALFAASPAQAALQHVSVLTQAQGNSREAAKDEAIRLARRQAVVQIARKIDAQKAPGFLAKLDGAELDALIRGMEIEKETRIGDTYYARLKVTVMDGPIRRAYGEVESEAPEDNMRKGRTILVLPVFYDGREPVVWDVKHNPTLAMWQAVMVDTAQGALALPAGDPTERAIVDRDNVLSVTFEQLKPMLADYGSDEMAVVVLTDALIAEKKDEVQVTIRRVRADGQLAERFVVTPAPTTSKRYDLYQQAIARAAALLTSAANATSHLDAAEREGASRMAVVFGFSTLKDWGILQQKIQAYPEFVGMDAHRLQLRETGATLFVKGKPEDFAAKLKADGLVVEKQGASLWRIRNR